MNIFTLRRIQAKLDFNNRYGPPKCPLEINQMWVWREQLAGLTLTDLDKNNLNFSEVSFMIFSLERHIDYHACMAGER